VHSGSGFISAASSAAPAAPWWAIPAATVSGVLITVAATVTLEVLRGRRDREVRLSDVRRQTYANIADMIRRQMSFLADEISKFEKGEVIGVSDEPRNNHNEAAVQASLVGSTELAEAIDYLYQLTLEALVFMRRTIGMKIERGQAVYQKASELQETAEAQALRIINIIRRDTGVPGNLTHQRFS
jgi:hypothetical protein